MTNTKTEMRGAALLDFAPSTELADELRNNGIRYVYLDYRRDADAADHAATLDYALAHAHETSCVVLSEPHADGSLARDAQLMLVGVAHNRDLPIIYAAWNRDGRGEPRVFKYLSGFVAFSPRQLVGILCERARGAEKT